MHSQGLAQDLVKNTCRFWQQRSGEYVSEEGAREAIRNVAALFDLLARWDAETQDRAELETGVKDDHAD
jgi:hypothetical protein